MHSQRPAFSMMQILVIICLVLFAAMMAYMLTTKNPQEPPEPTVKWIVNPEGDLIGIPEDCYLIPSKRPNATFYNTQLNPNHKYYVIEIRNDCIRLTQGPNNPFIFWLTPNEQKSELERVNLVVITHSSPEYAKIEAEFGSTTMLAVRGN